MKLAEAKRMKKGTIVKWAVGNGWYESGKFCKLVEVTRFPGMTFSDLLSGKFDLERGRKELQAEIQLENGCYEFISVRRIKPAQTWEFTEV